LGWFFPRPGTAALADPQLWRRLPEPQGSRFGYPAPVMEIRKAESADADAWLALRRALWPETAEARHRAEIAETLARQEEAAVYLAGETGAPPVGFVEVSLRRWAEGCDSSRSAT
jgi:hypothetical protein